MKRFLAPILLAVTFSVMFSSASFADWKKIGENVGGTNFYVDFERIRKQGGYVFFWLLSNYYRPDHEGDLSDKAYLESDCKLFRYKNLSNLFHKEPMGKGMVSSTDNPKNPEWNYPPPNTPIEYIIKQVCSR